jgi:hypothetical protein
MRRNGIHFAAMSRRLVSTLVLATLVAASAALGYAQSVRPSRVIDSAVLLRDLKVLSADDMQGRQVDTPGGAKAREYIVGRFRAAGVRPFGDTYEVPFTFMAGQGDMALSRKGINLIARVEGTRQPNRYIVVSAHYDHVGVRGGQVFNGADDNASGTAALLALAKYFQDHRPEHSIIFAAFDAEEAGLRGSRAFVTTPPVGRDAIVMNVNLDMVGRDAEDRLFAVGTHLNPYLKPYLLKVAAAAPIKLLLGHDDPTQKTGEDWTRDSDHWAFLQAGIPAIYLGVEDFAHLHKATDDYETMTFNFFVGAVETSVAVVKEFDANLEAIWAQKSRGN